MRKLIQSIISVLFISTLSLTTNTFTLHAQTYWHSYQTIDGVQIDYSDPVNCIFSNGDLLADYIFLKVTNLSNHPIHISFKVDHYYVGSGCITCTNNEYQYSATIPANGIVYADCNFKSTGQEKLSIFKKYTNRPNATTFEKFELSNIHVE